MVCDFFLVTLIINTFFSIAIGLQFDTIIALFYNIELELIKWKFGVGQDLFCVILFTPTLKFLFRIP